MPVLAGLPFGGPLELALIALVVIIVFGVGRLPEVGGAIGKSIREFRRETRGGGDDEPPKLASTDVPGNSTANAGPTTMGSSSDKAFCTECGAANARDAKFCNSCGRAMAAAVQ